MTLVYCEFAIPSAAMADDREVLREVWDGRVPAAFTLAAQEVREGVGQARSKYLRRHSLNYG